jgi:hypothetical protein
MTCLPAQELFQREVDNILGPEKLLPWSRFIRNLAGDPSPKKNLLRLLVQQRVKH